MEHTFVVSCAALSITLPLLLVLPLWLALPSLGPPPLIPPLGPSPLAAPWLARSMASLTAAMYMPRWSFPYDSSLQACGSMRSET